PAAAARGSRARSRLGARRARLEVRRRRASAPRARPSPADDAALDAVSHDTDRAARRGRSLPGIEQAFGDRVADEVGAAREAELLHDVRSVGLGRADRDEELLRDLLVRVTEG